MASIYKQIPTAKGTVTVHKDFASVLESQNLYINVGTPTLSVNTKDRPTRYVGTLRNVYSHYMAEHLNGLQIVGFRNGNRFDYHLSNLILE